MKVARLSTILLCLFFSLRPSETRAKCLTDRPEVVPKRYLYHGERTLSISLEVSERISHQLATHILRILLEEVIGYANVTILKKNDHMNPTVVLNRLSGCQDKSCRRSETNQGLVSPEEFVPETMVNLEVWTGPGFNMDEWLVSNRVEDCGPLGPIGRFGWYTPQYMTSLDRSELHIIDHWRALREEQVVRLFDLSDDLTTVLDKTRRNHRHHRHYCEAPRCQNGIYSPPVCQNSSVPCAMLLASYPNLTMTVIREQIEQLRLRVRVAWIGPHLSEYIQRRYQQGKPFIFFKWKPSPLTSGNNFTNILFPMCEDLPINFPFPNTCMFEINQLEKLAWPTLTKAAPQAMHLIRLMSFTQDHYNALLNNYYHGYFWLGRNVADIACDWVIANETLWSSWVPDDLSSKTTIYIGGIFPMSGINYSSKGIIPAASMAIEAVNNNQSVLRDYRLELMREDGRCSSDHVMKAFIKYVMSKEYSRIAGILGPACSDTVEPIAGVAKHFNTIIMSYSAEGAVPYSNVDEFPYFFRTIPSNRLFKYVYLQLFRRLNWKNVAALTEDGQKYPEYLSLTQDFLQANGINFIANRKFPRERLFMNMSQSLEDLKKKNAKIIIGDFYDYAARAVMCEAYKQGMTSRDGYVWFLPMWFSKNWYDTDFYNSQLEHFNSRTKPIQCSTQQMIEAINGHLSLVYTYYGEDNDVMQEGRSIGEWRKSYKVRVEKEIHLLSNESSRHLGDLDRHPASLYHYYNVLTLGLNVDQVKPIEIVLVLPSTIEHYSSGFKEDEISDYAGYAYDAVWVYALALDQLLKQNHSYIATLHTEKTTRKYADILNRTAFDGVSGHMRFLGPTRLSVINVLQWVNNRTRLVGRFRPSSLEEGTLEVNDTAFVWFTPDGRKPHDGSQAPDYCALEGLRRLLGVECDVAIIVANILGFGLFALLMILCFIFFKRRYEKKVRLTEARMRELGLTSSTNMLTLDEWEIPRDRVVINRKLGEGAFGTVFGGEAFFEDKGWVSVAVKTLKVGSTVEEKVDFLSEAEMMKRFEHKNIIQLLGVCTRGEPVYTVMEFMLFGDLKTYLLARRTMVNDKNSEESDEVSHKRLTSIALDVARGLSYLAELKYVHRDLACRNCLVNSSRIVKIGDFGMTRPMYDSDYYRFNKKGMLPVRWMAPESLADGIFTPMSDVWSYGILLFEVITFGSFPFQGLSNNQVLDFVKNGNTLQVPSGCKPQLEALLVSCWRRNAHERPTASELVELLANNPRLVTPCLELPLASVEIECSDALELPVPERPLPRKWSAGIANHLNSRRRSSQHDIELIHGVSNSNAHETVPMVGSTGNGGPPVIEPSKLNNRCTNSSYPPRYVTLQQRDGKPDDYRDDGSKELWQNVTCL